MLAVVFFLVQAIPAGALSVGQEKKIGGEVAQQFLDHLGQSADPAAREYVRDIGRRVVAANQPQLFDFHFYLVNHPAVNAFALPGGYVFIHTGLLLKADTEEELAGVIAHEIGHVTARHISDQISRSTKINLLSLATILGAIFLANDAKTAAAVSSAAMAGAATASLKYSREMEEQADRLGYQYLIKAGYHPGGLVEFMRKIMSENVFSDIVPSYLTTHPDPENRMVYLDGLVDTQTTELPPKVDHKRFNRIKTRVLVDQKDPDTVVSHFLNQAAEEPDNPDPRYGLALAYQKMGKNKKAQESYNQALALAPEDSDIVRDQGYCHLISGDSQAAAEQLRQAVKLSPGDGLAWYYLGIAEQEQGNFQPAVEALLKSVAADPDSPEAFYHLGVCLGNLDQECRAYYFLGLYNRKIGDFRQARLYLEKAANLCPQGDEYSAKAKNEIGELTEKK